MSEKRTQLPWFKTVKVGDVLRNANGTLRVVRKIHYFKDGDLRSINFVIMHCSWTKHPFTSLNFTDLRYLGYEPVGLRVRLTTQLDKHIANACKNTNDRTLDCCDVKGIA